MRRWLEFGVFAVLAGGFHIAFFASAPVTGTEAGGAGGETLVSVQAAAPTVVAMVKSWEQKPVVAPALEPVLKTPEMVTDVVVDLKTPDPVSSFQRPSVPMPMPAQPEEVVDVDTTPPPPPPQKSQPKPRTEVAELGQQNSAGRREQRSAGSGGGEQAGTRKVAQTATAADGAQADLRAAWGARIRAKIVRNKRYPRGVNASGRVVLALTISRNGSIQSVRVKRTSGHAKLDQAAVAAVKRARSFPRAPKALAGNQFSFTLPITMKR